jgi:response regulator of citrate/malate metabolism
MKNIILVEDDSILAFVVKKYIEKMSCNCTAIASSFDETIDAVKNNPSDLVLMDINLIGPKNGIDAAEEIRKFSAIPIFFLTGNSDKSFVAKMEAISNSTFLIKPVSFEDLKLKVETFKY